MKILGSRKALSPVVASIILIAVTVAVSIAVAAWMGAFNPPGKVQRAIVHFTIPKLANATHVSVPSIWRDYMKESGCSFEPLPRNITIEWIYAIGNTNLGYRSESLHVTYWRQIDKGLYERVCEKDYIVWLGDFQSGAGT